MDILSFIAGIAILMLVLKILAFPFKIIIKFIVNSILGGIILAVCGMMGIGIVIYWWTIVLTGLLGIPGLVIAAVISILL